jgi:hypothetical protein
MRYLRLLLVALLIASALAAASRASWEAHLVCLKQTFVIDLPARPIWSPPAIPAYDVFKQAFSDLPATEPSGAVPIRVFRYDYTVFWLFLYIAVSSAICGLLYLFIRRGLRDVVLHYALFVAVGYILLMVPCYPIWCWGSEMLFSFLGVGFGLILATFFWRRHAA